MYSHIDLIKLYHLLTYHNIFDYLFTRLQISRCLHAYTLTSDRSNVGFPFFDKHPVRKTQAQRHYRVN